MELDDVFFFFVREKMRAHAVRIHANQMHLY